MPRAPDGRNTLVDALRGVCFVFMTVDHLPGNLFSRFSNPSFGPFGFFSAAPGFVLLSGLVAGFVYERHRVRHGTASMVRRVLRRIRDLYATQMILYAAVFVAVAFDLPGVARWDLDLFSIGHWKALLLGAVLLYEPGYFGILPMYCFFLALTPIVLWRLQRGNLWQVLGSSGLLWIVSGLMIRLLASPLGIDVGGFNPLSYQILFIFGLAFGTGRLSIERLPPPVRMCLIASSVVAAALFFALRQQYAMGGRFNSLIDRRWFSVVQLGPLRLLNFAAAGVVLYWVARRVEWEDIESTAFRWLAFVGRHSLPVFAWSILTTYTAVALFPPHPSIALRVLSPVLATASLTIPALLRAMITRCVWASGRG